MVLIQTFNAPVNGWWDGGPKRKFTWSIDGLPRTDGKGKFIRVGSWDANYWCTVACGKTDRQTLGNLRRRLMLRAKRAGVNCTFRYE